MIRLQDLKRRSFRLVPPSRPNGGSVVAVNSLLIIVTVAALGLRAPSQYI